MYDMKALYEARSVEHAIRLLQEHPQAQIIAGGSDVLVQMREGKRAGAELVSIYGLDELRGVSMEEDGTIRIGPLTSFSHIIHSLSPPNDTSLNSNLCQFKSIRSNLCQINPAFWNSSIFFTFSSGNSSP